MRLKSSSIFFTELLSPFSEIIRRGLPCPGSRPSPLLAGCMLGALSPGHRHKHIAGCGIREVICVDVK